MFCKHREFSWAIQCSLKQLWTRIHGVKCDTCNHEQEQVDLSKKGWKNIQLDGAGAG